MTHIHLDLFQPTLRTNSIESNQYSGENHAKVWAIGWNGENIHQTIGADHKAGWLLHFLKIHQHINAPLSSTERIPKRKLEKGKRCTNAVNRIVCKSPSCWKNPAKWGKTDNHFWVEKCPTRDTEIDLTSKHSEVDNCDLAQNALPGPFRLF